MSKSEQWRDVVGYKGLYQVSDLGRVRSLDRVVPHGRTGTMRLIGRVLRAVPKKQSGYLVVGLSKEGVAKIVHVHQLVAAAWIGSCPDGCEVRHGPAGKLDNSVDNLCYGTHSQNGLDMRRDGTHNGRCVIRSDGIEFASMALAAEESGCAYQNIGACCKGCAKTAGGYGWKYLE